MNKFKKILGVGLALILAIMPISAQAAEVKQPLTAPVETVEVKVQKLMYEGEAKEDSIINTGEEITDYGDTDIKVYDKSKYGDVEFSIYKIADLSVIPDEKDAQTVANEIEAAVNAEEATAIPYGAELVTEGVVVDDNGVALFSGVINNENIGYVIIETKHPTFVVGPAKPMFIRLPMMNQTNDGYLDAIALYPKNNVEPLTLEFIKYGQANGTTEAIAFSGAQFKLYFGEPGQGQVVKASDAVDAEDLVFTSDAEGKITLPNLIKGNYYLVEQEVADLVDGMLEVVEPYAPRDGVGTYLTGGDAQNDAFNKLTFAVDAAGEITTSDEFKKYVNYERPEISKDIVNVTQDTNLSEVAEGETADNHYSIFQDINFKAEVTIPENIEVYSKFEFEDTLQLNDVITTHLEFNPESILLKAGDVELVEGTDYLLTVDPANNTFKVDFIMGTDGVGVTDAVAAVDTVEVTYSAQFLNVEDIVPAGAYSNEINLTYNNSPNGNKDSVEGGDNNENRYDEDEETFTTYGFIVKKVNDGLWGSKLSPEALEGAKFILLNAEGNVFKGFVEGEATFAADGEDNYVFTSDANGQFGINGLESGSYVLREIQAPEGYRTPFGEAADTAIEITDKTHEADVLEDISNIRDSELVVTGREETIRNIALVGTGLALVGILVVVSRRKEEEVTE